MKTQQVIYKGARDGQDYDDFTFDQIYLAHEHREGFLEVLNDKAIIVEMPSIDFDFNLNQTSGRKS